MVVSRWLAVSLASVACASLVACGAPERASGPTIGLNDPGHGEVRIDNGLDGGVDLLRFGLTGDTRPPSCDETSAYPSTVITAIVDGFNRQNAQFALDLGDHMFVCSGGLTAARAQMAKYTDATAAFQGPFFMTMGNHECTRTPCLPSSTSANYTAYMDVWKQRSQLPYYAFDVPTRLGLATFVVVADNAWSDAQAAWLDATLSVADQKAKYTFVARHHPDGDTSVTTNGASMEIIQRHKVALFLTGHSHLYRHPTERSLVIGIGGAPLNAGFTWNGYAMVQQVADGDLEVSVYSVPNDTLMEKFTVGANP